MQKEITHSLTLKVFVVCNVRITVKPASGSAYERRLWHTVEMIHPDRKITPATRGPCLPPPVVRTYFTVTKIVLTVNQVKTAF
jgi:hypothetical protein